MIYSPPLLVSIPFFHLWGSGLRSWLPVSHHTALSGRTGAQLPQWSPGWSCNPGELRIHPSQRRRNPHTALDCPLGRILLHQCSAGGQREKTQQGVGCGHTRELLMVKLPVNAVFFLLALTPPLKKPFPPVDSETMLSWIPFYFPSCLFSDPLNHAFSSMDPLKAIDSSQFCPHLTLLMMVCLLPCLLLGPA